jgi:GrpB-like predicted nucleotidyltransferase (UPF0157 family)
MHIAEADEMVLGLKCGVAELADHDPEWEVNAADTIKRLWDILGSTAKDIQHVGSSVIRHIKAKPVIDIAVSVWSFEEVLTLSPALEKEGFIFRGWEGKEERQPVFQCGEYIPEEKDMRLLTHYIHIVMADNQQWYNYINFRDYMNAFPAVAFEYEALKLRLAEENKNDYRNYHHGKQNYITEMIKTANHWDDLGRNLD